MRAGAVRRDRVVSPLTEAEPRWATPRTPTRPSHGGRVAVIAEHLGKPLLPWQRMVADVICEYDPATGLPYYREWRLTVPRQSGKTQLVLPKMMTTCLMAPLRRVIYTAQTYKDARKKFLQDQIPMLERNKVFGNMFDLVRSNGEERITWRNGSVHGIAAVTDKAGHGGTLDEWVGDEAFALDWAVEQAMRPAMSTVRHAQLGIVSTAGKSRWQLNPHGRPLINEETGEKVPSYLWAKVQDGRARVEAGQRSKVAYFEYSADDDVDLSDPSTWAAFMPALGYTQSVDTILADYDGLATQPGEFERAYGNRWPGDSAHVQIIPPDDWARCADPGAEFAGRAVWSVAVSEDRSWAAIGGAGSTADGRDLVALLAYRCDGTGWVVPYLRDLRDRRNRDEEVVGLDPSSPAGSLIADLEAAEFVVKKVPLQGKAHAAGGFYDAAVSLDRAEDEPPRLVHRAQSEVTTALESAVRRYVGENAFIFEQGASKFDICPLQVAVYALWTHSVVPDEWYETEDSFL